MLEDKWNNHVEISWAWLHDWGTCSNYLRADCYKWNIMNLSIGIPSKSGICKVEKFSKGGKRPRKKKINFWIYGICEETGRCLVCGENINDYLLLWTLLVDYDAKREYCWRWKTFAAEELWVIPHGFMVWLGAKQDK